MSKGKVILIASLISVVSAVVLLVSLFLPYASMKKDLAKDVRSEPAQETPFSDKLNYDSHDLINVSLFKYTRIYSTYSNEFWGDSAHGIFYVVLFALFVTFGALVLLFSALRKPIPVIIFDVFLFIVFLVNNYDYKDRGIIPGDTYEQGIVFTLYFVFTAVVLVSAMVMLVMKIQLKKENNAKNNLAASSVSSAS